MNQIGLFEDLLFRELGGTGNPSKEQIDILKSLLNNKIIPIVGGWYVPDKRKTGRILNTIRIKAIFSSSTK